MPVMAPERLHKVSKHIAQYVGGLIDCEKQFELNTPLRVTHFLAQLSVESKDFSRRAEDMFYSTASQIHENFSRISIEEAKELSSATPRDVYWMNTLLGGGGYLMKAMRDDRPKEPRDKRVELEMRAYGKAGAKGAGLIQLTRGTKKDVLAFVCREYRKNTDKDKPKPLRFIESLQGAERCTDERTSASIG